MIRKHSLAEIRKAEILVVSEASQAITKQLAKLHLILQQAQRLQKLAIGSL